MLIEVAENGIHLVVEKAESGVLRLLHLASTPFRPESIPAEEWVRQRYTTVEIHCSGESQNDAHGAKHTASNPGGPAGAPVYVTHRDIRNEQGRRLELVQQAGDLQITSVYQFFDGIPVLRAWTELENRGPAAIPLEYVSSFALTGLTDAGNQQDWNETGRIHLPFNSWMEEMQWREFTLPELGLSKMSSVGWSFQRIAAANTGTYCAKEKLPMGIFEDTESGQTYAWQIETHCSWAWEIAAVAGRLYLQLSGPTERENQWFKNLRPEEKFVSVPAAVAVLKGNDADAFRALNLYRRRIRRPNADNRLLPVIFNDYMNCLMADPSTEKELPLIDRAAELGAEYYVIDAGWFSDGDWSSSVGEWLPNAPKRFPDGLQKVLDYIVAKGMKPGLWLELERMNKNCRPAKEWPDECFFCRHGRRVLENNSLQPDFRHPLVRAYADEAIDRLVGQMGVRFIKMDYNMDIGPGTEINADSFGDGLQQHQQAYLDWLDKVLERHPDLIMENCSSGGMRNTYSLLSRLSLCSTTDNQDYLQNARISINCASAYCLEQAGVWVYPLASASVEEVAMNMVSALSWRPYLSGQVTALDAEKLNLLRQGVELYQNELRPLLPDAEPYWPLGLVKYRDSWGAFALKVPGKLWLSVWHFNGGPAKIEIPVATLPGKVTSARLLYPVDLPAKFALLSTGLCIALPEKSARLFEIGLRA